MSLGPWKIAAFIVRRPSSGRGRRVAVPDPVGGDSRIVDAGSSLGPDGAFITGRDLLVDAGVIAAIRAGRVQLSLADKEHRHGNRTEGADREGTGRLVHRRRVDRPDRA